MRHLLLLTTLTSLLTASASAAELQTGVRGIATRAPSGMKIDGDLAEWDRAFCTPVGYLMDNFQNRAAQFYYMWDDEAFYAALRTCDAKPANHAADDRLWEGDGVEWYFDTRQGDKQRAKEWGPGAVHMYWTGFKGTELKPRWCLRPDMLKAIAGEGVEVAARKTKNGAEVEFKLPWKNFPDFKPAYDAVIALDAELCYSDGGPRVERTFAYGSPLSVQQPASQGLVQLVARLEPGHWRQVAPVMLPIRCDTEWTQSTKPQVTGLMAIPPFVAGLIDQDKLEFRLLDTEGKQLASYLAKVETIEAEGKFLRAKAQWAVDAATPGAHLLVAVIYSKSGKELARVTPRMVSDRMQRGY